MGPEQLNNLILQKIPFLFIDLRVEGSHPRFIKAQNVEESLALEFVKKQNVPGDHPIVVICEDGVTSLKVSKELEKNSYINVYILDQGTNAYKV